MPGNINGLSRFRADPEKVRIGVRCDGPIWIAAITSRMCGTSATAWTGRHRYAYRAVVLALVAAEDDDLDGIDLSMGWAYFHPMCTPVQRAHYDRF